MGYSSKKNFSPLTDDIGLIIDGCGNSHEKKYYVNGMYIDLCGLSVEGYMTNPCCGGSNSGEVTPSKSQNKITVTSVVDEESGVIYYQANASYPVTSTLKISVKSSTGVVTELEIYVGETQSKQEVGESVDILTVVLDVTEDDNYKYVPTIEGNVMEYMVYVGTPVKSYLNNLSGAKVQEMDSVSMSLDATIDITFIVPGTDVNYNAMNDADFEAFCEENQHAFVIAMPTELYENGLYAIANYGGDDMKEKFVRAGNVTIDSVGYTVISEYGVEDIMPYVPLYGQDNEFIYKFSLIK